MKPRLRSLARFEHGHTTSSCFRLLALLLLLSASNAQSFRLHTFQIEGNDRFPSMAIIGASGLVVGARLQPSDFDEASTRLRQSGFFEAVRYRFAPTTVAGESGYELVFEVREIKDLSAVRVDIPGLTEEEVWASLS